VKVGDLKSISIKIASPEEILSWSHGEVKRPETINYRTQRPEKDGLFCEKIFGPTKDFECYCGKYKGARYKGIVCDRCGVEVTKSSVRRERMGHIKLAVPVAHIWFSKGAYSTIGFLLNKSVQKIEKVIYFSAYIITEVDESAKQNLLKDIKAELGQKIKELSQANLSQKEKKLKEKELKGIFNQRRSEILEIKPLKILSEPEYRDYSLKYGEVFEAGTGAETLRKIFEKFDIKKKIKEIKSNLEKESGDTKKKSQRRLKFLESMEREKIRPEWMFLTVLPVLPPDLRPMVQLDGGRYASSDLNDLYRRVINRNNRLKYLLEISAPDVIVRNEKRMLQEAVDALLDNKMRKGQTITATTGGKRLLKSLADILAGKQGRFRKNLLGKRVDYSGRSVIAPGPDLKLYQCGLPKIMALEIFRPFVIKELLDKELAYNIRGAGRLIEEGIDEVWAILEEVVKDKLVLLNRAPTLHRLGIQAFQPVLIEGKAIKLHPLVCNAFNADFDGDQMGVFLPLSKEAQEEASQLMISSKNLLKPASGMPVITPTQDIVFGIYFLTKIKPGLKGETKIFSSQDEALMAYRLGYIDVGAKIKVAIENASGANEIVEASAGRILFNQALPSDYRFVNEHINKKILSKIISEIAQAYPENEVQDSLDKIKKLGFEYATLSGMSWGMDDLVVPKEKENLIKEADKEIDKIEDSFKKGFLSPKEKSEKTIEIWHKVKEEVEKLVPAALPKDGTVFSIIDSGARGSWAQPVQMAGMKGLVSSPSGRIIELPVKHSFKEGFDVLEYFISTHGARKGTADTALRTSASGYLTRRLVDVSHEVIVLEKDCHDTQGVEIFRKDAQEIDQDFIFKIVGRYTLEDIKDKGSKRVIVKKGQAIDWDKAKEIDRLGVEKVRVRSPLTCKSTRGVCQKCYGMEMGRGKLVDLGQAVGIVAAQSIGEPGTQLTMRTFHLGGVSGGGDITQGLPRVEEIFEARKPKGEGIISLDNGTVKDVDQKSGLIKVLHNSSGKNKQKKDIVEYVVPKGRRIYVKKGDLVAKGQPLSEGNLDLKKLFKTKGEAETKRYILKEVQKIYVSEGINIHDKHIEVIIRQMFSRIKITDAGDSYWVPGEIVSKAIFEETNRNLEKENKKKAKGKTVLLGISKVALSSDSFLSAASFQETSRVLIRSALEGRKDGLHGLKENVIIGRLIPAGTGFRLPKPDS